MVSMNSEQLVRTVLSIIRIWTLTPLLTLMRMAPRLRPAHMMGLVILLSQITQVMPSLMVKIR